MSILVISFKDYKERRCSRGCCYEGSSEADICVATYDSAEEAKRHTVDMPEYSHRCLSEFPSDLYLDKDSLDDGQVGEWIAAERAKEEEEILRKAEEIKKRRGTNV